MSFNRHPPGIHEGFEELREQRHDSSRNSEIEIVLLFLETFVGFLILLTLNLRQKRKIHFEGSCRGSQYKQYADCIEVSHTVSFPRTRNLHERHVTSHLNLIGDYLCSNA
ncbi:hypothetical protein VNO77_44220 [Canavalia gladiata]|uniref:Uncharacterized protein n=1 Tax=Canavalia gladiata TaxID=3824 RepID=A0AAN9JWN4_CANGL